MMNCAWPPDPVFWKRVVPPELVITVASPAVLASLNSVNEPELVVIVAAPAVLVSTKNVVAPVLLVMNAVPAVLVPANSVNPVEVFLIIVSPAVLAFTKNVPSGPELDKVSLFEELLTMPVPSTSKKLGPTSNVYAGAPALSWIVPMKVPLENVSVVVFEAPKVAVPVGTVSFVQFVAVSQSELPGAESQVAS